EERLLGEPAWLPAAPAHWLYLLVHATHHIRINRCRFVQLVDLLLLEPELPAAGVVTAEPAAAAAAMARALYPPLALLARYAPAPAPRPPGGRRAPPRAGPGPAPRRGPPPWRAPSLRRSRSSPATRPPRRPACARRSGASCGSASRRAMPRGRKGSISTAPPTS